jgi:hypothetical protein
MGGSDPKGPKPLSAAEIADATGKRLARYEGMNFFEQFAMFMGVAQLLEISLKQLLNRRYGVPFDQTERWTLGRVARSLRDHGLREDFLAILDSVVTRRNHIAHNLLASQFMLAAVGAHEARFEVRELEKGIYELEQLWLLFELTDEHDGW